jgi:hypothetical protein
MSASTVANGAAKAVSVPPSPEVVDAILKWSVEDRRDLAILLQDSIREGFTSLAEGEKCQKDLIHSRIAQLVSGEVESRDAEDYLNELEARYQKEPAQ